MGYANDDILRAQFIAHQALKQIEELVTKTQAACPHPARKRDICTRCSMRLVPLGGLRRDQMKTVSLCDGKYEFDLEDGQVIAARRHKVYWPAGFDLRFTNCFVAALERIIELEECVADPRTILRPT